jgi:hypothetical protein
VHPRLSKRPGLCLQPALNRLRSVLSGSFSNRILVLAQTHEVHARGESMSLYRAALRLALLLPLGVAIPLAWRRFRRCELRFHLILADQRDP